jgi:ATP-dependent protease ClpP protease subunit
MDTGISERQQEEFLDISKHAVGRPLTDVRKELADGSISIRGMGNDTFDKLNIERPQDAVGEQAVAADPQRRVIYLFADVLMLDAAAVFIAALADLAVTPDPIRIVLCSTGGSEPAGWAIYDAIRECPCEVTIDAIGAVWSMAVPILQAADVRRMSRECRLMVHAGTVTMGSESVDQRTLVAFGAEAKRTNRRYQQVIADRTGIPLKKVAKWCEAETYFSARSALKEGLIDAIVPYADSKLPKKRKRK